MSERKADILAQILRMVQNARPDQIRQLLHDVRGTPSREVRSDG